MKKATKNQEEETEKELIAKEDGELAEAAREFYEWGEGEYLPVIEDVFFHWITTYDEALPEYRANVVFKFRRIMDLVKAIAKIEEPKAESMKLILEASSQKAEIEKKDNEIKKLRFDIESAKKDIDSYKLILADANNLLGRYKKDVDEQRERADKLEEDNKCFRPKINKPDHYNCKLEMVRS